MEINPEANYEKLLNDLSMYDSGFGPMNAQIPFELLKEYPKDLADRLTKMGYSCDLDHESMVIKL